MNYKNSIIGSAIAFIVATSCCWLPALLITIGGGSTLVAASQGIEKYSNVFMALGAGFLGLGVYQFIQKRKNKVVPGQVILQSIITCPLCGFTKEETMPENACQFFYACENCQQVIKPKSGDCCVYCSYGTVSCPPVQSGQNCC